MFSKTLCQRVLPVFIRCDLESLHLVRVKFLSSAFPFPHVGTQQKEIEGPEIDKLDFLDEDEQYQDFDKNFFVPDKTKTFVSIISESKIEQLVDDSKNKQSENRTVKYPLRGMGCAEPLYTNNFRQCELYLKSLNIPTDELQFYPDVQKMSEKDIICCIERLKEYEIHVIFSLFLIQRIFIELTLERTAKRVPKPQPKQWFKLRNGMYKLTYVRSIIDYKELCTLLKNPSLDPVAFMDRLAENGIYDHLHTIVSKSKKMRSIGAEPEDIMNNLKFFHGYTKFNAKMKLYQNVIGKICKPFPVNLFLSPTIKEFKEKLEIGSEVKEISKLLNVKESDFLMYWKFKPLHTKFLVYKIQMCLKAGITQSDIFNNIGILNRITVEQCLDITESLRKSGQPGSVMVFKELDSNIQHKLKGKISDELDWTRKTGDERLPDKSLKLSTWKCHTKYFGVRSIQSSSKWWRKEVFKLIAHLLDLDKKSQQAMFKADINIDHTQLTDITHNLDYLLSHNFTKEEISRCPLILTHPSSDLVRVKKDLGRLMTESTNVFHSSLSLAALSPSCLTRMANSTDRSNSNNSCSNSVPSADSWSHLLSDPIVCLNVLQYFLEKETSFSLHYAQTQSVVEFLN